MTLEPVPQRVQALFVEKVPITPLGYFRKRIARLKSFERHVRAFQTFAIKLRAPLYSTGIRVSYLGPISPVKQGHFAHVIDIPRTKWDKVLYQRFAQLVRVSGMIPSDAPITCIPIRKVN